MPDDLSPPVYASVSLILYRHTRTQSGPDKAVNLKLMARKKLIAKKKMHVPMHTHLACTIPVTLELVYGGERLSCDVMY